MEADISRITVDHQADWYRVQTNANDALAAAVEEQLAALPGGSGGDEAKRVRPLLEARIKDIRERMWEMMKPNLRVNGFNYEDFVETTENFDEALDRSLWALNDERVGSESTVVEQRRRIPDKIANCYDDLEERRGAAMWDISAKDEAAEREAAASAKTVDPSSIPKPPRHDEVQATFADVVADLGSLVSAAPEQRKRAERVYVVQEELASMPL